MKSLFNMFAKGAKEFLLDIDEDQLGQFQKYMFLLKEWNQKINLTAIIEDQDILIKHFLDSLSISPTLQQFNKDQKKLRLIDVGTGAGFPGIPIKITMPEIQVTLLDSLQKRVNFLNEVIREIDIKDIEAVHGRAEDFGRDKDFREKYDIAVARAVSNLPVLVEYCLPYVKIGGIFVAMKGSNVEEVSQSEKAIDTMGGKMFETKELSLPFGDMKRNLIIIKKIRHTPTIYPRKAVKIDKNPL